MSLFSGGLCHCSVVVCVIGDGLLLMVVLCVIDGGGGGLCHCLVVVCVIV